MIFTLIIKTGEDKEKTFVLDKEKTLIGRDPSCDLVINDIEISRQHSEITIDNERAILNDLDSTNGTFLNGKRIAYPTEVHNSDLISLGKNIVLEFNSEKQKDFSEELQNEEMDQVVELDSEQELPTENAPMENDILEDMDEPEKEVPTKKSSSKLKKRLQSMPTWTLILVIALVFLIIFCVIPLLVIEATDQWCNLFAGFFNSMSPGVCP